jgi:hypothetical protein
MDPTILAFSMMRMYGDGAEAVARGHAEKHGRAGDLEKQRLWSQVADNIKGQQQQVKEVRDENA